ncbi:uncharacterized protein J3D65DRAFT_637704 [Phyllosticta citribraziliensis]|uniref:Uncharacterized protein n=1 Tax=Phyllosticta citribraziliensis TaxID=989973 RepID=A0ABR1L891_9PEZI
MTSSRALVCIIFSFPLHDGSVSVSFVTFLLYGRQRRMAFGFWLLGSIMIQCFLLYLHESGKGVAWHFLVGFPGFLGRFFRAWSGVSFVAHFLC